MKISKLFSRKKVTRYHYVVSWEAMDNNGGVIKGHTEVNMPQPWQPGDIDGVLDYIASLNDGGVQRPTPNNIFFSGTTEVDKNA